MGPVPELDVPGAVSTMPSKINNRGQIVGLYRNADFVFRSFFYDGDTSGLSRGSWRPDHLCRRDQ